METKVYVNRKCNEIASRAPFTRITLVEGHLTHLQGVRMLTQKEWQKKNREEEGSKPKENERIEFEKKYKIYTDKELAKFTPRQLILELKARGYVGTLLYEEVIVNKHLLTFLNRI